MRKQEALDRNSGRMCVYYKDEEYDTWRDKSGRAYILRMNRKTGEVFSVRNPELDIEYRKKSKLPIILPVCILLALAIATLVFILFRKPNNESATSDSPSNSVVNYVDSKLEERDRIVGTWGLAREIYKGNGENVDETYTSADKFYEEFVFYEDGTYTDTSPNLPDMEAATGTWSYTGNNVYTITHSRKSGADMKSEIIFDGDSISFDFSDETVTNILTYNKITN